MAGDVCDEAFGQRALVEPFVKHQPDRENFRGDILETEDREIEESNA